MKKFTVTEATMLLENGREYAQFFTTPKASLKDFVQYVLRTCSQTGDRLRVRGWYDGIGFTLEIFFPLKRDEDVRIMFDSDVHVNVDELTGGVFRAGKWYEIGYTSSQKESRNTAGFGSDLYKGEEVKEYNEDKEDAVKKFTVSEAKMLLENGSEVNQVFNCSGYTHLDDFVQYLLETCSQTEDRDILRVRGLYDVVGFVLEIYFPLETDDGVQIKFDSDVRVDVDGSIERRFIAGGWYYIGYTSAREEYRNTAGFGSDLYKGKEPVEVNEDKEDVRSYNVGSSDYAKHTIQPWDIWREYNLNPWDADIVKRVLRTKETDGRRLDYEKIIHICKERIRQIDEYGK